MKKVVLLSLLMFIISVSYVNAEELTTAVQTEETTANEVETQPVVAPKVKNLKDSKTTTTQVSLKWNKAAADGYEVYQYKEGSWTKVNDTAKTSYTVKKLKKARTYKFKVRAYTLFEGNKIYGEYSDVLTAKTKFTSSKVKKYKKKAAYGTYKGWKDYFDVQDGKPSKIKYKKGINISWKKIKGAKKYEVQVYRYSPVRDKWVVIQNKTVKKTKFVLTDVKAKETYKFKVRAVKTINKKKYYSSYSKSFKIKPKMSYSIVKTDKNYNPISKAGYDRFEAEKAFVKQNEYRRQAGVPELVWNEELYEIAKIRAKESSVEGCEPHYRPDGKYCDVTFKEYLGVEKFEYYKKIAKEDTQYDSGIVPFSENWARGQRTGREVVKDWYDSEGHKECMLNIDWNYGAIAVYSSGEGRGNLWISVFSFSDIK